MNNKVTPDSFRSSMDRVLSGSKADPFLASRIIASEKGEPKMKKAPLRIVLVLIVLIILATVAYAATQMHRRIDWKGNIIEEYPYHDSDFDWFEEFKASAGISPNEAIAMIDKKIADIPDGDDVIIKYTAPDGQCVCSFHPKQKCFTSFDEFKEFMADCDYLTVPAWLPDNVLGFSAKVHMEMSPKLSRNGIKVEEYEDGPQYYRHFTYDDSFAVITGYQIWFYTGKGTTWITSDVGHNIEPAGSLSDTEVINSVDIKGMDDSLLVSYSDGISLDLQMHRKLKSRIRYKLIDVDPPFSSDEESIIVKSSLLDKGTILRIFNGE